MQALLKKLTIKQPGTRKQVIYFKTISDKAQKYLCIVKPKGAKLLKNGLLSGGPHRGENAVTNAIAGGWQRVTFTKKFKKCVCLAMSALLSIALCGCGGLDLAADGLLTPPKSGGDMLLIEKALKKSVEGKYTLKYPTSGKYRSAYISVDLTGTGRKEFAVAFYGTQDSENVSSMHLNLMKQVDSDWISISDIPVSAVGVEKVAFSDLDGDGILEIAVGWNVYGGVDKRLCVYSLKGLTLTPRMQESYSDFVCCNLKSGDCESLLLLSRSVTDGTASAKLYSFFNDAVKEDGSCKLDSDITSYCEPAFSRLTTSVPAVFVDEIKGSGMQTEIIYINDGILTSSGAGKNNSTYRDTAVTCADIDNDGSMEIPVAQPAPKGVSRVHADALSNITKWCGYDGNEFVPSLYAVMNYVDGYYFVIPDRLVGKTVIVKETESRLRTFCLWDTESGTKKSDLFKIRTVTVKEWDKANNGYTGYSEILRSGDLVYIMQPGAYDGEETVTLEEAKNLFHTISGL